MLDARLRRRVRLLRHRAGWPAPSLADPRRRPRGAGRAIRTYPAEALARDRRPLERARRTQGHDDGLRPGRERVRRLVRRPRRSTPASARRSGGSTPRPYFAVEVHRLSTLGTKGGPRTTIDGEAVAVDPIVVVGAGLAGLRAAEQLRAAGDTGPIVVVGREVHPPYNRPPLTKDALKNGVDATALQYRQRASTADVTWRLGESVVAADLDAHTVTLDEPPAARSSHTGGSSSPRGSGRGGSRSTRRSGGGTGSAPSTTRRPSTRRCSPGRRVVVLGRRVRRHRGRRHGDPAGLRGRRRRPAAAPLGPRPRARRRRRGSAPARGARASGSTSAGR